ALATWQELYHEVKLINAYGTSETTITNTVYEIENGDEAEKSRKVSVPIGRPLDNTKAYVLDEELQPVPAGVPGELYLGGIALSRGYLNRADLTAERFIPDPYSRKAGARMYRTGDRARYLSGGELEFLGRVDQQLKLRGYRIEPGEIEATLKLHPAVREAVVVPHVAATGDKRLVAYVTQDAKLTDRLNQTDAALMQEEQLAEWQMVHDDEVFNQAQPLADPTFNISGWNSSYTGSPFSAAEMREWVDDTVERIERLRPRRVLEIGCGTGLLLFRLMKHCEAYVGTDFSPAALAYVREQLEKTDEQADHVTLLERRADDFSGIEAQSFDTLILNSVVQYFPSAEYLLNVLEQALHVIAPSGTIFIGDVRSLPLLEAFHATVEMHQADPSLSLEELRGRIRRRVAQEEELVIAPAFFNALKTRFPNIGSVRVMPKRGSYLNEMSQFRYQVLLQLGEQREAVALDWVEWKDARLSVERIRLMLEDEATRSLCIKGIKNARVSEAARALKLIDELPAVSTVAELRERLRLLPVEGLDPQELWSLSEVLPYEVEISWIEHDADGSFDALFNRRGVAQDESAVAFPLPRERDWSEYANEPLRGKFARQLVPHLREFLRERLPGYMIPSAFVLMENLPLTAGGKVDRQALPAPEGGRPQTQTAYTAPATPLEKSLAELWTAVLGVAQVGLHDNFFELGGHSLLATQLISRLREVFQVEMRLRQLFEHPTVA
ncbi:MAG: AMP-binding protein, partial [Acidobacteria bacterium]|nr:AMP-binding protein [Acidobacteriota bacterium]